MGLRDEGTKMESNDDGKNTCLMSDNDRKNTYLASNNDKKTTCLMLNKKGITLIELVIAIGLLSVVMAIGYSLYLTSIKSFLREATSVDNQFNVMHASSTIGRQLRRADTVTIDAGKLKITYPNGTSLVYYLQEDVIMGGSYKVVEAINSFVVSKIGNTILMTIQSEDNSDGEAFELSSEITIRK